MTDVTAATTVVSQHTRPIWTVEAIRGLGATTDVETAAAILSIGRTKAYELAKSHAFPVRVLRIGRRYVVPVPEILNLLGVDMA
ncbi:MAG TPA: helix-turn-helix domain-containing protein [Candidatus Limnocylindrales bacterium]|nr:helix-turn-helix domain-containing protein [Candidatus Limnocylindrales bacterium]HZO69189.1 helix-turn-helix domain-containing protein [Kribbellaceae bacterium]